MKNIIQMKETKINERVLTGHSSTLSRSACSIILLICSFPLGEKGQDGIQCL